MVRHKLTLSDNYDRSSSLYESRNPKRDPIKTWFLVFVIVKNQWNLDGFRKDTFVQTAVAFAPNKTSPLAILISQSFYHKATEVNIS